MTHTKGGEPMTCTIEEAYAYKGETPEIDIKADNLRLTKIFIHPNEFTPREQWDKWCFRIDHYSPITGFQTHVAWLQDFSENHANPRSFAANLKVLAEAILKPTSEVEP